MMWFIAAHKLTEIWQPSVVWNCNAFLSKISFLPKFSQNVAR
jgi:hypothetical protein